MKKRMTVLAMAASLVVWAGPSLAEEYTSPDWAKFDAELKTLPPDFLKGDIPQSVIDTVLQNMPAPAGAPQSWKIVHGGDRPHVLQATRVMGGLIQFTEEAFYITSRVYDPLGLIEIEEKDKTFGNPPDMAGSVTVSSPISVSGPIRSTLHAQIFKQQLPNIVGLWLNVETQDCELSGSLQELVKNCNNSSRSVFGHADLDSNGREFGRKGDRSTVRTDSRTYRFDTKLGAFFVSNPLEDALDWKIGDQPWNSQTVSASLTAAQKDQARALFARGFELFKSGDLTGARALVESGLKTDPGNHLGWFTLGEIARSTVVQNPDKYSDAHMWGENAVKVYYRHTIDLAPNSPEAVLAKGYLAALR